jgi:hypothetical protein
MTSGSMLGVPCAKFMFGFIRVASSRKNVRRSTAARCRYAWPWA